ncbi:MAG: hypothetical protein NWE99_06580 [Candidatus Bathyarchaeota archaeon]|nr:hypothetical protein [Candidatus Bathyarchaeota archaeon]
MTMKVVDMVRSFTFSSQAKLACPEVGNSSDEGVADTCSSPSFAAVVYNNAPKHLRALPANTLKGELVQSEYD